MPRRLLVGPQAPASGKNVKVKPTAGYYLRLRKGGQLRTCTRSGSRSGGETWILEECRDEWIESALGDAGDPWDYVLARVAIDFRRELTQDDDTVLVRCRLERLGTSSLTLREEIRTGDGELSAEAEAVLVARERETGRSRPLRPDEREAFERALGLPR